MKALCAILDTVIALLNHFPLFALMLRIKDPMRLSGQVAFRRLAGREGSLILEPALLSSVFVHYAHLWSRLANHYGPEGVFCLLLLGRRLTRIPRAIIRFSMVPKGKDDDESRKEEKQ
ncbi:hypothetical protein POSPLADRAFT_1049526 [Postia placenta MAD-698-R-SB12]|uniref:Uncharacterized protein n=1 Tax=Postia placenta MAD-698-R-SB12 TaxID=670580 RepID=A0A1X6MPL1_9APHY|nr:hypothetical protein POSPLADRAFT_1049526 [Postia placenta MAD-698-R-SB12]OSX58308.1 hypothetical protein POSPLADRAFT_1049526 [Postia placenta MAD-698-R-SB12]